MRATVTITGVENALREAQRIGGLIESRAQQALTGAVLATERDTKARAPVDTGRLRSSYRSEVGHLEGSVYTDVEYAPPQEYGTRFQTGTPHLFPSAEANAQKLLRTLRDLLRRPNAGAPA